MSKRVNLRPSSSGRVQRPYYWNVSMKHTKKKSATEVQPKCMSVARSIICWGWNVLVHMIHCREWACARGEDRRAHQNKTTPIQRVSLFKFTSTSAVPGVKKKWEEKNVNKSWARSKAKATIAQTTSSGERSANVMTQMEKKKRHGTVCWVERQTNVVCA